MKLMRTVLRLWAPLWVTGLALAAPAPKGMTEAGFRASVATLASDAFEGRKPGQVGEIRTLDWIEGQYRALGLKPGLPTGYRQPVMLVEIKADPSASLEIAGAKGTLSLAYADDTVVWTRRVQPTAQLAQSPMVFVGHGIHAPEYGWDDYAGIDMHGKTAVILVNDPGYRDPALFRGKNMTYYGRWVYKYEEAMRQGAEGALIIHQTGPAAYGWDVVRNSNTGPLLEPDAADGHRARAAVEGWISNESARKLFDLAGLNLDAMEKAATTPGFKPVPLNLSASVSLKNTVRRTQSANVVGVLPGAKHPNEYVLYMAHWDHFGNSKDSGGTGDTIYNGAVDNATGVAGILEVAKAFTAGKRPDRSVVFVAVTAEESGLLGSAYYGQNPVFPLSQTAAAINIDAMYPIGRMHDIEVVGYGASELEDDLKEATTKQGRVIRPDAEPEKGHYFRSDHFNLAKHGVPSLYTETGIEAVNRPAGYGQAFKDDYTAHRYHKPSDEYSVDWDVSGILDDLRLLQAVGSKVANERHWPEWYPKSEFRAIRDASRAEAH
jgi:Zn-dependent M28 family amino/carboxypeptidase